MLQQPAPDNYVIASGETHSVREFCDLAFQHVGLDYRDFVVQEANLLRPPETGQLVGNPSKARINLGWKPTVTLKELVSMMVDADLDLLRGNIGQRRNP